METKRKMHFKKLAVIRYIIWVPENVTVLTENIKILTIIHYHFNECNKKKITFFGSF